jgi:crossover junction endodeoxyribonuclease RusA
MKLVLPFPPSVNTYWRAPSKGPLKGRHLISEKGRAYQSAACVAIIEQLRCLPKPSTSPADVRSFFIHQMTPPRHRQLQQALFDALTHAGIWEDDSQVKRMLVEWGPKVPGGRLKYRSAAMNKKMAK